MGKVTLNNFRKPKVKNNHYLWPFKNEPYELFEHIFTNRLNVKV